MLKNNPVELLEKQLSTPCCILNSDLIGLCREVIDHVEKIDLSAIPKVVYQPRLVFVKNLYSLIEDGLYQISMKNIKGEEK